MEASNAITKLRLIRGISWNIMKFPSRLFVIVRVSLVLDSLDAELNPICHLLALLRAHHIFHVSWVKDKRHFNPLNDEFNPICQLLALVRTHHIFHVSRVRVKGYFNPLNAKLNPLCHLLALLRAHHIFHVSWVRVKGHFNLLMTS